MPAGHERREDELHLVALAVHDGLDVVEKSAREVGGSEECLVGQITRSTATDVKSAAPR
jgi:hypothetical protein